MVAGLPGRRLVHTHSVGIDRPAMTYLVDANGLSQAPRPQPNAAVVEWLSRHKADLVVSPIKGSV
jgi:hypothetical protein